MKDGLEEIVDIDLNNCQSVKDIIEAMGKGGGFTGRYLSDALQILREMLSEENCLRYLSFPASMVATGVRGILSSLLDMRLFDVVLTTCGTLDHDLARAWAKYYKGDFNMDDKELDANGYHRLGSVLIPKGSYGELVESRIQPFLEELYNSGKRNISPSELARLLGNLVGDQNSILKAASKNSIPVIIPGIMDGAVGSQLWLFSERHRDFSVDVLEDERVLSRLAFDSKNKKSGALILGGGISKHHTLWWNQFRGGLDYAVYITTASEFDGSLSGAITSEAISWGKIAPTAKQVNLYGDATLILPFLVKGLER